MQWNEYPGLDGICHVPEIIGICMASKPHEMIRYPKLLKLPPALRKGRIIVSKWCSVHVKICPCHPAYVKELILVTVVELQRISMVMFIKRPFLLSKTCFLNIF